MPNSARKAILPEDEDPISQTSASAEKRHAIDQVFSLAYEELRRVAALVRRNEVNATINTTALVHEAWIKLKDSPHLAEKEASHFKAIAAKAMRQVLVDEARRRIAHKRGGGAKLAALDDTPEVDPTVGIFAGGSQHPGSSQAIECGEQLLELDGMLEELFRLSPRQAEIFESRFFAGLSVPETAAALNISESSVERDYRSAKAWLAGKIRPAKKG